MTTSPAIKVSDYKDLKLQLDGFVPPGQGFHRNLLLETLYASLPRDPQVKVQIYNAEIVAGGFSALPMAALSSGTPSALSHGPEGELALSTATCAGPMDR